MLQSASPYLPQLSLQACFFRHHEESWSIGKVVEKSGDGLIKVRADEVILYVRLSPLSSAGQAMWFSRHCYYTAPVAIAEQFVDHALHAVVRCWPWLPWFLLLYLFTTFAQASAASQSSSPHKDIVPSRLSGGPIKAPTASPANPVLPYLAYLPGTPTCCKCLCWDILPRYSSVPFSE